MIRETPIPGDQTAKAAPAARGDTDLRGLVRLAGWGAAAVLALMLAVFATRSELGSRRMAAVMGPPPPAQQPEPPQSVARAAELDFETRQLAVAVRSLSADRDRLLARVTVLERNLEDVTGSIPRTPKVPVQADETAKPEATAPETPPKSETAQLAAIPVAIGPTLIATISSQLMIPSPSAEALAQVGLPSIPVIEDENTATRTSFGVDIGSGPSVKSLRSTWTSIRQKHGDLFEGLYPVIAVRDGGKPGPVELRLIIGPLTNAATAARLCGKIANAGLSCQPAIFDGQRLALR